ncbi:MAG: GNAT family N-acetyltransferase [Alphaproteobacteria bacterium]|nr:GNAT family N-acetyltransferase [Alphaproteobacteria bacterium]
MTDRILPLAPDHFDGLRRALDIVAREKRYLSLQAAPSAEVAEAFYRRALSQGAPFFVALAGDTVVGWCDVLPTHGESRVHVGILGVGLVPEARGRGLGPALMRAAIARAWANGLTRIELSVRADNTIARSLYLRLGFVDEGFQRQAVCVDGVYHDCHSMALLR